MLALPATTALAGEAGSSICRDNEDETKPKADSIIAPGMINMKPASKPPFTPPWVMPMANATCVLEGPGRQLAMATSSAKRSLDSQANLKLQKQFKCFKDL